MLYADFNGSAPVHLDVRKYLGERLEGGPFANPNAGHRLGVKVRGGMENCRKICADVLGADPGQVIFNSGSTEGISHIFYSILGSKLSLGGVREANRRDTIVISTIEHSAVYQSALYYQKKGFRVIEVSVDESGVINMDSLKQIVEQNSDTIALVAVMAANNETGIVQPYAEISAICGEHKIPYLCDTTQFIGKSEFNFKESGIDYCVLSGHKIGALTGCGILLAKRPNTLQAMICGGGQENDLRGGTQNYIGNETLAVALESFSGRVSSLPKVKQCRDEFEKKIKENFPQVIIIGDNSPRLSTTSLISFPGLVGLEVQAELEAQGVFVTTSSACSDKNPNSSRVLSAMGIPDEIGGAVVRISFCSEGARECYSRAYEALSKAYTRLLESKKSINS
ncbi:MAG: aminotransferase class V-fold PLP-dependent enzyme [Bacteriovoracaceae bacterium]|jgi:cysteine desulfurase|nr:aminotransferase class V-fold PLP-dependent enzyme [Bacteriovoracaceae bacterium]